MLLALLGSLAVAGPRIATPHADALLAHAGDPHVVVPAPPAGAVPPPSEPVPDMTVYAYHPYWESDPTQLHWDQLTHVAIFDVELKSDGTLANTDNWTDVAAGVVAAAHAHGVKVDLCVISFDDSVQSSVLPSASKRATAVAALKSLVDAYGADGVNVDVEAMDDSLSGDFVQFIKELHAEVGEVYIATPAVDWLGAYDYSELAANSEGLFIMGYGYYWTGGDPGPNDPLYGGGDWSTYSLEWSIQDYQDYGAPVDKIVLGLPLYGQEWPADHAVPGNATGTGWSIEMESAMAEAATVGDHYEPTTHSPYYLPSGSQVWYPDVESVRERIAFAREQGLQGVGFWAVGYEGDDPDFWPMVAEETTFAVEDTGSGNGGDNGGDSGGTAGDNGGNGDNGGDNGGGPGKARVLDGEAPGGCACAHGSNLDGSFLIHGGGYGAGALLAVGFVATRRRTRSTT